MALHAAHDARRIIAQVWRSTSHIERDAPSSIEQVRQSMSNIRASAYTQQLREHVFLAKNTCTLFVATPKQCEQFDIVHDTRFFSIQQQLQYKKHNNHCSSTVCNTIRNLLDLFLHPWFGINGHNLASTCSACSYSAI